MNRYFTRIILLVLVVLPVAVFAQQTDYTLALNTGKFVPAENATTVSKQSAVFQRTYFAGKNYLVLQFNAIPTQAEKDQLTAAGITLVDYLPRNAYTAIVPASMDWAQFRSYALRSVLYLTPEQKAFAPVLSGDAPLHAITEQGYVNLQVQTYEALQTAQIRDMVSSVAGRVINEAPVFRMFSIRVPKENVRQLAELPFIQWMEYADPPNQPENKPGVSQHHVNVLHDGVRNLKGDGMNVGAWDEIASQHLDFWPSGRMVNVNVGGAGQHGTHLSGTIAGRGLVNPIAKGMAPNAKLYSYNGYDGPGGGGHFDNNLAEMAIEIPAKTLVASNHSYHDGLGVQCNITGAATSYSLRARNADLNLNTNTYHLHCHSAGNAQASCANGWFTITGTGKAAKNNIVVGALTSTDGMTSFSSFGPVNDGRVKPEICAFGNGVFSTNNSPLNSYASLSGTSMATPGIAGTLTLVSQRYKELNANVLPPSALVKNVACNTALDLGNPGPDYRFGFGRVNALRAVRVFEENRYSLNTIAQAGVQDITLTVPAGAAKLNVMLTWNDPAGAANSATPLVNNLDLTVINGPTTTLPWVLNPNSPASNATKAVDNISNIEQVTIDNPPSGTYTLRVTGTAIPTGPQDYALTWNLDMPFIEVTFPNGGESLNPGTSELLTWDNAGVTANQTVEYSLDGTTNWTTIGTVAAATNRLNWSVPAAFTATAKIRVTSGALTDMSDNGFKILGTVTGFAGNGTACNPGEVNFSWSAVTNATNYDIYRLDPVTGEFVILSPNVTGTSHTATGLTPNTSMWFTIRAKNNTNNAESERAIAINVTTSNGGGGVGNAGPVTGNNNICGTPSGVPYSIAAVAGATTYTWTVPTGAVIASGQGTTSITVNYTAGSLSGNITVAAGNGVCSSTPTTYAITVGSSSQAAPGSGGNQSQTICPGAPVPTLTATASVGAGFTVVWYNAASGGSVVASPTLSTVGTVTYYAGSRETSTGCESTTRTPVTLTISSVAAPSIAAGGPTSFCQGGTVTLTASAGNSWTWSNGATTQAITVNAGGNYSVTVVNNGCTNTTSAVTVTVNPTPAANVTAGGATTFCQGASVTLTASAGSSWLWSNGATTQSINVTNTGNYSVTVTNASGCSASSAATAVTASPNPTVTITASPYTSLLPGQKTTLTANVTPAGTYSYAWFKNGTQVTGASGSTLADVDLDDLGSYTVTVQNTTGLPCSNTSGALAIDAAVSSKLFIWPTPNDGQFDVSYYSAGQEQYTIVISDNKGALVYKRIVNITSAYQRISVDLRGANSGLYMVALYNKAGKRIATGKVVTQ